jgi:hypothetical protein
MGLSDKGKQLRQCEANTLDGFGPRCRKWAKGHSMLCSSHNGRLRRYADGGEKAFKRMFPLLYKKERKHLRCQCSAYPFPHQIAQGFCNWPDPPIHQLVITDQTNNEETKLKKKLRKMGIHNKSTNCIKKRTSNVRPITKHKPEDFRLEEDYLARMEHKEDFSSLPIEEKRRIWKEQILAEFYRQYPRFKEFPYKIEIDGETVRYKIVKDRDGESWIILEDGRKIALSE